MSRPTFLVLGGFLGSEWEDIWQRQHEWTAALMRYGNVIYLERAAAGRAGVRRAAGRLAKILRPRGSIAARHLETAFPAAPEFVSWLQLPLSSIRAVQGNAKRALAAAERRRLDLGWEPFSLVHVGTPSEVWVEAAANAGAPVWFDSAERFRYSAAYAHVTLCTMERQVVEAALVTTDTGVTRRDWHGVRDDIEVVPHGAKSWAAAPDWEQARRSPYYVGSFHPALDTDFLVDFARLTDRRVAMLGEFPPSVDAPEFKMVGWAAGGDIPQRLSDATAGLVPYRSGPWCEGVYPSKVYDYFLAGVPAISTALPALDGLEWAWQVDGVASAADALQRAEALGLDERRSIREFALANTWDERFERIRALLIARGVDALV